MNNQNLKIFSSTYRPKNPGRKPNIMKKYLSGQGRLSKGDIQAAANYILNCPREKLQEIVKDVKRPTIMVTLASAMLGDIMYHRTTTAELLMQIVGDDGGEKKGKVSGLPDATEKKQFAEYEYPAPEEIGDDGLKNVTPTD